MPLAPLTIRDRHVFQRFLRLAPHTLSVYTFENIYIWKALYDISWSIVGGHLCLFFKDRAGCFAYLAPLGPRRDPGVIRKVFAIMDAVNRNRDISRIENVEESDCDSFRSQGYRVYAKPGEYLCRRDRLVKLTGNDFKSKRACVNYFMKHYAYKVLDYAPRNLRDVAALYRRWSKQRQAKYTDTVYRGMLGDSRRCLAVLLGSWKQLRFIGKVVTVDNAVVGFTCGYTINARTFCVMYEIADSAVKGLAQFIFREFCSGLKGYTYINIMDDSGLENIQKTKLSYRPVKIIPAYIVARHNAV